MPAAYDNYDYPAYWKGREYEHSSEFLAIKEILLKIPKVDRSIEIGAGFGRLLPIYQFRVKRLYSRIHQQINFDSVKVCK